MASGFGRRQNGQTQDGLLLQDGLLQRPAGVTSPRHQPALSAASSPFTTASTARCTAALLREATGMCGGSCNGPAGMLALALEKQLAVASGRIVKWALEWALALEKQLAVALEKHPGHFLKALAFGLLGTKCAGGGCGGCLGTALALALAAAWVVVTMGVDLVGVLDCSQKKD